jgi:GMP synthase (glutamine-hydrolysing)
VIESVASKTGKAHVIKSPNNVGGLPGTMKMQLVSNRSFRDVLPPR